MNAGSASRRAVAAAFAGAIALAMLAPPVLAQRPVTQSIAVGEPDPGAPRLPAKPRPIPQQVDATFKAWDADHNGALSIEEFRAGYRNLRRAGGMQGLRHQFATVDANKNDAIDASEYGSLLLIKNAGKSAPALSAFDTNKNQRLEFGEYVALVRRMSPRPATSPAAPEDKP